MGSTKAKQQLGDLLQQEQEPFALELYLFERGYFTKNRPKLESTSSRFIGCCNGNISNKYYLSRILRTVLKKFTRTSTTRGNETRNVSDNNSTYYCDRSKREAKFACVDEENNNNNNIGQVVFEVERESFSSDNSGVTTVFNSPTSLDKHFDSVLAHTFDGLRLSNLTTQEVYAGRDLQCQFMPKHNQLSPISVLQQTHQSKLETRTCEGKESQTTCTVKLPSKLVVGDSTKLSASICKLNFGSISENSIRNNGEITDDDDPMGVFGSDKSHSQQYVKSKRIMLQHTQQLLFDCVREIISEKVEKCHNELFGQDELGNLLLERMKAWDKIEIGNDSKTISLTTVSGLDIFDSYPREWKNGTDFENREICFEIGDSIAEDFIDEIVVEFQQ